MSAIATGLAHVVIAGLGNIGASLAQQIARLPAVGRLTLIDYDKYELDNLQSQAICRKDVGHWKALAQQRVLNDLRPELEVCAITDSVEHVPWGRFRSNLILGALDSRRARLVLSQIAWRLGVPYVDSGVLSDGFLARVNTYKPDEDTPCLECAWSDDDYRAIEQRYPCGTGSEIHSTNAPHCLGALAASLQALESIKILDDDESYPFFSKEILWNAGTRTQQVTNVRKNPQCRFDHLIIPTITCVEIPVRQRTLGDLINSIEGRLGPTGLATLSVGGQSIARVLLCPNCGRHHEIVRLEPRFSQDPMPCRDCGHALESPGLFISEELEVTELSAREQRQSIGSTGLLNGDVLRVVGTDGRDMWIQIHCDTRR